MGCAGNCSGPYKRGSGEWCNCPCAMCPPPKCDSILYWVECETASSQSSVSSSRSSGSSSRSSRSSRTSSSSSSKCVRNPLTIMVYNSNAIADPVYTCDFNGLPLAAADLTPPCQYTAYVYSYGTYGAPVPIGPATCEDEGVCKPPCGCPNPNPRPVIITASLPRPICGTNVFSMTVTKDIGCGAYGQVIVWERIPGVGWLTIYSGAYASDIVGDRQEHSFWYPNESVPFRARTDYKNSGYDTQTGKYYSASSSSSKSSISSVRSSSSGASSLSSSLSSSSSAKSSSTSSSTSSTAPMSSSLSSLSSIKKLMPEAKKLKLPQKYKKLANPLITKLNSISGYVTITGDCWLELDGDTVYSIGNQSLDYTSEIEDCLIEVYINGDTPPVDVEDGDEVSVEIYSDCVCEQYGPECKTSESIAQRRYKQNLTKKILSRMKVKK